MPLYIGLISGTSADGIDAALVSIESGQTQLLAHFAHDFSSSMRERIHALCAPGDNEIDRAGALDRALGIEFAEATLALLETAAVKPEQISAIGSHGQTIRHRPPGHSDTPFTWQIGDPNIIAQRTGICTVADLRRRDMAAGGQGAPLVPAFHQSVFTHPQVNRAIINIGGIGNISWLQPGQPALGFDTGPGNTLMDAWILKHQGKKYDANGNWAREGEPDSELLATLLEHPYLARPIPKSTGREDFHLAWLESHHPRVSQLEPQHIQATLLEYTAQTLANHLHSCPNAALGGEAYVCGGGAHNSTLMSRLQALMSGFRVETTDRLGIAPDWVEASAFAWLAHRTLQGLPGNLASVTGACEEVVLGAIYPGRPRA
ncbi:anhydro-N-acetylmuramic acid kinase [Gilvimarinus sp. SDUM040013]|uniref:Anhydro-N-acetylmuramic acid kinase n=1 Tax=Gilvimarinus gilvus TaxID=3058038 RepID=A0ABU4RXG0_9GAMM|nr:anhydro-N-acetylmuramic acid kinase [Gilvimarinus sp. SDUM040013]MDO3386712.1 anhydro-N-acetylmuramic acid kinase [Gilvimarinus sp. SDUM040013]MDX6848358.1 anhydro-N-acetylmuramic acid kinase [Gilvimarinus sp. SDUM040013]